MVDLGTALIGCAMTGIVCAIMGYAAGREDSRYCTTAPEAQKANITPKEKNTHDAG